MGAFFRLCVLACVCLWAAGAPARAQTPPPPSADQLALADQWIGGPIAAALDTCLTDSADAASIEAGAVSAGWPAFENSGEPVGRWRTSAIPPGDRILASFGVSSAPLDDAPVPTMAVSCMFIMPTALVDVLNQRVAAKFPSNDDRGFYILENGALRELTMPELLEHEFPEVLAHIPPSQRLVAFSRESSGPATAVQITILHPRAP